MLFMALTNGAACREITSDMLAVLSIILKIVIGWSALLVVLYPLHALIAKAKYRKSYGKLRYAHSISVIVPVKGVDEEAYENYSSILQQEHDAGLEIIFSVADEQDACVEIIRQAMRDHPQVSSRLVISGSDHSFVGKMHNLAEGIKFAQGKAVVLVDSDVRMQPKTYLKMFVRPLANHSVGLVTCSQTYYGARSLGAGMLTLGINADLFGYFATLYAWNSLNVANGAVMAARTEVLDGIGGLVTFKNKVLSDTALARTILGSNKAIVLEPAPARVFAGSSSLSAWWHQACRWHVAMKSLMPLSEYMIYALTRLGLLLAISYALLLAPAHEAVAWVLIPLLARTISVAMVNGFFIKDDSTWKYFGLICIIDLANFVLLVRPFFSNRILWRGRRYRVLKNAYAIPDPGVPDVS